MTIFEQLDQAALVMLMGQRPDPSALTTSPRVRCLILEKTIDGYDLVGVARDYLGSSQISIQPHFLANEYLNLAEWDADVHAWKIPTALPGEEGAQTAPNEWIIPTFASLFPEGE